MKIQMKTLKGDVFSIEIDESASFLDLKTQVHSIRSTPIQQQKLVYKGKVMDDKMIIGQIGIRQSQFVVLMNSIVKKKQQSNSSLNVEKQLQPIQQQKKVQVKPKNQQDANNQQMKQSNQQKPAIQQGEAESLLQKNLGQQALQLLVNSLSGGGGSIQIDNSQGIIDQLIAQNPQLAQKIQQRPQILQQILMSGVQYMDEEGDDDMSYQQHYQMELTPEQDEAVKRLENLGFTREDVIQIYFACDKNEQIAANMLFDRNQAGEFPEHPQGNDDSDNLFH